MMNRKKAFFASVAAILVVVLVAGSLFLNPRGLATTVPTYNDVASYDFLQTGSTYVVLFDGAVVSSGTNATAVLQSALNLATPLGEQIHVWAGIYNITNTININPAFIELYGDGRGTTIFDMANDSNCNMFYVAPNATMFTLRDMELDGCSSDNNSVGIGVYINQTSDPQINSCYICNFASGDVFISAGWGAVITNSEFDGSTQNGLALIGCYASIIQGNTFSWNLANGVIISGQRATTFSQNTVYANSQDGILLDGNLQNTAICSNWINDNGIGANNTYDGIHGNGASFCSITGNVIDGKSYSTYAEDLTNMERSAIYLDSASSNNIVTGNTCQNSLGPEIVGD